MNVLVAFLIMFVPIWLVYGVFHYLSYKNWTSVYTAINDENYFKAIGKLKQAGIRYKTKSQFNQTSSQMFGGDQLRLYEIYVKKEDAKIANHQLHS